MRLTETGAWRLIPALAFCVPILISGRRYGSHADGVDPVTDALLGLMTVWVLVVGNSVAFTLSVHRPSLRGELRWVALTTCLAAGICTAPLLVMARHELAPLVSQLTLRGTPFPRLSLVGGLWAGTLIATAGISRLRPVSAEPGDNMRP